MRSRVPLIAIAIATVVAIGILVVGSRAPGGASGTPSDTSTFPSGHSGGTGSAGMIDAATLEHQIQALERAHSANPASLRIALNLGDAYYDARQLGKAAASYLEALKGHPGHPSAVVRLAMVWYARGAEARAVKSIQGVIRSLPDSQEAHFDLAIIYFHMEDVQAARSEWIKAARIDPGSQLGQASQDFVDLLAGQAQTPAPAP